MARARRRGCTRSGACSALTEKPSELHQVVSMIRADQDDQKAGGANWRPMTNADLIIVERISRRVHPTYPEDISVLKERLTLYPQGSLVLGGPQGLVGYAIAHPWMRAQPPRLNTHLERLPAKPDTFYIHDLALLAEARRTGAGSAAIQLFVEQAERSMLKTLTLVAVAGSTEFWHRHGFRKVHADGAGPVLLSYGNAAQLMVRSLSGRGSGR